MTSLTDMNAPGAYPVTPLNEEPPQEARRNKLHKRQDPRGWNGSTEQNAHSGSHNWAGSGTYVVGTPFTRGPDPTLSSRQDSSRQPLLHKETPRSLTHDGKRSYHSTGSSAAHIDDSPFSHSNDSHEPGLMTGAYSRVGTRDSAFAQEGNYTHNAMPDSQSPYGNDSNRRDDATQTDMPENIPVSPKLIHASNNALAKNNADHNTNAESGSCGDPKAKHHEAYWGDIPFGVGIYNGVTGHGSKESTTRQKPRYGQYDTAISPGIYNGVTGHGSKEPMSPKSSKRDRDATTNNDTSQQHAFLIGNNANIAAKMSDANQQERNSHSKGVLAGAGATAVGGYAAHKHSKKDINKDVRATNEKPTDERASGLRQRNLDAPLQPYDYKGDGTERTHRREEQSVPYTPVAAGPMEYNNEGQTLEEHPLSPGTWSIGRSSNLGRDLAAGAAAAAGVYGTHAYANRGRTEDHQSVSGDRVPLSTASYGTARKPTRNDAKGIARVTKTTGSCSSDSSHGGQYNVLPSGTPSGINLEQFESSKKHHKQGQSSTSLDDSTWL
ncbi:hypothetical protein SAMD00023353_0801910 [Rosellinia necatrix]|uniref:Uncharacterized protein n=1 Tax=Rosellinia necatrix TaxID=77044 RepID=A0A1W2TB49_ROSNE|nr:hypothetical protein SAMD00023353_0801910 [Rosellinia necatrix]